uniref:Uncharacterized protein n=1 Tax=Lactuca sativa TaxID=4236 RepID=A0A9R1W7I9_LACSA|nr:hypothetical protein LSAT_V11C300141100 [Lactuca sativa]
MPQHSLIIEVYLRTLQEHAHLNIRKEQSTHVISEELILLGSYFFQYLENRECEYDQKTTVDFLKEGEICEATLSGVIVVTSTPDKESNKYYLGPAPLEDMQNKLRQLLVHVETIETKSATPNSSY